VLNVEKGCVPYKLPQPTMLGFSKFTYPIIGVSVKPYNDLFNFCIFFHCLIHFLKIIPLSYRKILPDSESERCVKKATFVL